MNGKKNEGYTENTPRDPRGLFSISSLVLGYWWRPFLAFFFESIKDSFFFYVTVNLVKYIFLIMSAMGFLPNLFVLWNWCPSSIKGNNSSDIKKENEEHRKRSRKYSVSLLTSPGPPFRQNKHLPYSILKGATSQPSCRKLHKFRKNSPFVSEVKE